MDPESVKVIQVHLHKMLIYSWNWKLENFSRIVDSKLQIEVRIFVSVLILRISCQSWLTIALSTLNIFQRSKKKYAIYLSRRLFHILTVIYYTNKIKSIDYHLPYKLE